LVSNEDQLPARRVCITQNTRQEPPGSILNDLPDPAHSLTENSIEFEGFASDDDADDDDTPVSFKQTPNFQGLTQDHQKRLYEGSQQLFEAIRNVFKSDDSVDFTGDYEVAADPLVSDKERTQMLAHEVWKVTGYRFTCVTSLQS
jgi:hypothetical protein